jgi:hypothetical protein
MEAHFASPRASWKCGSRRSARRWCTCMKSRCAASAPCSVASCAASCARPGAPALQVMHRDLSSANIFLRANGDVLVGDLGVSKKIGAGTISIQSGGNTTRSFTPRTMIGTPQYLSPELLAGDEYGPAADTWAVGILLFEMLALERPFEAMNLAATVLNVTSGRPTASARAALKRSCHPEGLCILASEVGLLNTDPQQRERLEAVLQRFPLPQDGRWRDLVREPEPLPEAAWMPFLPLSSASELASSDTAAALDTSSSLALSGSTTTTWQASPAESFKARVRPLAEGGTTIPAECPALPLVFDPRAEVIAPLLERASDMAASGLTGATALVGMGGVGKSTIAAALLREVARRGDYDRVCWVSVGQTPDLCHLFRCLQKQLLRTASVDMSSHDLTTLSDRVTGAASGLVVFVVVSTTRASASHCPPCTLPQQSRSPC